MISEYEVELLTNIFKFRICYCFTYTLLVSVDYKLPILEERKDLLVIFYMNPTECSSVFERNSLATDKKNAHASGCFECLWGLSFSKRYYTE
jgi:hypothetical protein